MKLYHEILDRLHLLDGKVNILLARLPGYNEVSIPEPQGVSMNFVGGRYLEIVFYYDYPRDLNHAVSCVGDCSYYTEDTEPVYERIIDDLSISLRLTAMGLFNLRTLPPIATPLSGTHPAKPI